jgi:4-diphosphocytidyl-2-C-methyl-D-erythritol kinase
MKLDSFAKINLYLSVRGKRRDNYHGITTVFERISLKDTITFQPRKDSLIKISANDKKLACDKTNFVWQAVELLRNKFKISRGLDIRIIKRVPLGSGMGGGSSNAASVLAGLNRFWKLGLSVEELAKIGAKIGSDVPFFIYDRPFALGRGRGEKITVLRSLSKVNLWHVIVVPGINVSTALIYRKWDESGRAGHRGLNKPGFKGGNNYFRGLTTDEYNVKLISLALKKSDLFLLNKAISNSLEPVTETLFPQVRRVKNKLRAHGAQLIMMSGSGPAVFGIVSSKKEAVLLSGRIRKENPFWRVFVAKTY